MTRRAEWIFARVALLILAVVALVTWLSFLPGCSVDSQGLSEPTPALARGAVDTGVTEVVTTEVSISSDAATSADTSPAIPDSGVDVGNSGSDATDGGSSDSGTIVDGSSTPAPDALPPSECPISGSRSLSVCTATTQLCRYYDTGAPVLMVGCTAEGKLCVSTCN